MRDQSSERFQPQRLSTVEKALVLLTAFGVVLTAHLFFENGKIA